LVREVPAAYFRTTFPLTFASLGAVLQDAFPFGDELCQRLADRVVAALRARRQ
jgi:hypothetical protein